MRRGGVKCTSSGGGGWEGGGWSAFYLEAEYLKSGDCTVSWKLLQYFITAARSGIKSWGFFFSCLFIWSLRPQTPPMMMSVCGGRYWKLYMESQFLLPFVHPFLSSTMLRIRNYLQRAHTHGQNHNSALPADLDSKLIQMQSNFTQLTNFTPIQTKTTVTSKGGGKKGGRRCNSCCFSSQKWPVFFFFCFKARASLCCVPLPCIWVKRWLSPQGGLPGLHLFL